LDTGGGVVVEERRVPPIYTAMVMGLAALGMPEPPSRVHEAVPEPEPTPPAPPPEPLPEPTPEGIAALAEYERQVAEQRELAKQKANDRLSESTKKALERAAQKRARRAKRGW
jgi:hypothetical protein